MFLFPRADILASVILSGRDWIWVVAALFAAGLVLVWWNYRQAPVGPVRWACTALKLAGLAALLFCLLEPLWSGQRVRSGANQFLVMADTSQGLQVKDAGETRSRGEILSSLLGVNSSKWQSQLEEDFDVRRYTFDSRLQPVRDFSELRFDGASTALGGALMQIRERYRGRPVAGVLLFTDGNATDLKEAPELQGMPIYPVVLGRADSIRDLALAQVRTTQTDFEDAPVQIAVDVTATGYRGSTVVAQVVDAAGKTVAEQSAKPRKDEDKLAFLFQVRPEKPGLSFYRVQVGEQGRSLKFEVRSQKGEGNSKDEVRSSQGEGGSKDKVQGPGGEATLANNAGYVAVTRGSGPYRVLYVSGRPNWDFKFLNRAVQEDPQLQLTALIRAARREPRFNFIGRAGETSNPLFRGFDTQAPEEVERYDQPVLVRLNTQNEQELRSGFPASPADLFVYHAVIVDDLEAEFFTPDQSALLQRFVSERGGGFLMLGGMESFQQGKYYRTPIGEMLPVYLDRSDRAPSGPVRMRLTREGLLQSWARVRDNEAAERERLEAMVPFQVLNPVREVKPGASIIAEASDAKGTTFPALAIQRFGHGRTGAMLIGDTWRWGFRDEEAHRDMDKAWRQLVRWLVTDAPSRVDVLSEHRPLEGDGAVSLQVTVRDPDFQPVDNATVTVEVRPIIVDGTGRAQTNVIRLPAEPAPNRPGTYHATYVSRGAGAYQASVAVTDASGADGGRAHTGWATDLASEEFHSLKPNIALLEEIARRSGGQLVPASDLASFVRTLPTRTAPVMEPWTYPLWHTPAVFAFALACLVGEWGLRRWKGLP